MPFPTTKIRNLVLFTNRHIRYILLLRVATRASMVTTILTSKVATLLASMVATILTSMVATLLASMVATTHASMVASTHASMVAVIFASILPARWPLFWPTWWPLFSHGGHSPAWWPLLMVKMTTLHYKCLMGLDLWDYDFMNIITALL